ncbi:MAG: hypothetical protein RIR11_1434 [Bacteroidota bacterium]|jgi:hypothetical protein
MFQRKYWLFLPFIFMAAVLVVGGVVMFLWNAILPEVTGVRPLTFIQAIGLLILCRILFGGFRGGGRPGGKWGRGKWGNMSMEEKARMRAAWEERCKRS